MNVFSWRPIIIALLTFFVAVLLACGMAAIMALDSIERFEYAFMRQLPSFLAGMLAAGIWCGCLMSYWLGMLAGVRHAASEQATRGSSV